MDEYIKLCEDIAKEIESIKSEFPQLIEFEVSKNLNNCKIDYQYKCHNVDRPGWRNIDPDPEGIWLYIELWDENNPSQINTQPFLPKQYIKDKRMTFLIIEGEKTNSVNKVILEILKKHGLRT